MKRYEYLFKPIKVGRLLVKNRIEAAPAMPMLGTGDCDVSVELIEWYKSIAKGGAGIVTIGDSPVIGEVSRNVGHILDLSQDRIINGLNKLAEVIKRYGAKASIELTYHVPHSHRSPTDLTLDEIKHLIESYAKAAFRCMAAEMDMIMIHGGHGHLISQFISPRRNLRTDQYGGTFKNRIRFILELLQSIREKVGDRLAIEYRISGEELTSNGLRLEEQIEFVKAIEDKIDLIHVSCGMLYEDETVPRMIQPLYLPRGINVPYAEAFKKALKIPVATVGSIDIDLAEEILSQKKADIIAMARALIADPDAPLKAERGENDIRPCIRCNTCIHRTHMFFLPARCTVNPYAGREVEFRSLPPVKEKKKVVVIGGGPAGLEAASILSDRGHEVILYEKEKELGGALRYASYPDFKKDLRKYLEWTRKRIEKRGVILRLATEATPERIRDERPDALIIAIGAEPIFPDVPLGKRKEDIFFVTEVYGREEMVRKKVVVVGAGLTGSETALYLSQRGKDVTLIDMQPLEKIDSEYSFINIRTLRSMLKNASVTTLEEVKLFEVQENHITLLKKDWERIDIPCETLVIAMGFKPNENAIKNFLGIAKETYMIGDCNNERGNLYKAISEGFFVGTFI